MNVKEAENEINVLYQTFSGYINESVYTIYEDFQGSGNELQISLDGFSDVQLFSHCLLSIGNELINLIPFATVHSKEHKENLTQYIVQHISELKYQRPEFELRLTLAHSEEDISLIQQKVSLFEAAKQDAVEEVISQLKDLLTNKYSRNAPKLIWKGKQTDIADLFGNLIAKGWIEDPRRPDAVNIIGDKDLAATLNAIFDFSTTERGRGKNKTEQLRQHLKPGARFYNNYAVPSGNFYEIKPIKR